MRALFQEAAVTPLGPCALARTTLMPEMREFLIAVRAGAETAPEVAASTGLPIVAVVDLARVLVGRGLLCALDGMPWAIRAEALAETGGMAPK